MDASLPSATAPCAHLFETLASGRRCVLCGQPDQSPLERLAAVQATIEAQIQISTLQAQLAAALLRGDTFERRLAKLQGALYDVCADAGVKVVDGDGLPVRAADWTDVECREAADALAMVEALADALSEAQSSETTQRANASRYADALREQLEANVEHGKRQRMPVVKSEVV